MTQRDWQIVGYRSTERIFETKIKKGCFSDAKIEELLRALTAKAGFECEEIVGAYAKRGSRVSSELLHVQWDFESRTVRCGTNPYVIAKVPLDSS